MLSHIVDYFLGKKDRTCSVKAKVLNILFWTDYFMEYFVSSS